jgi:hypothetical protein
LNNKPEVDADYKAKSADEHAIMRSLRSVKLQLSSKAREGQLGELG